MVWEILTRTDQHARIERVVGYESQFYNRKVLISIENVLFALAGRTSSEILFSILSLYAINGARKVSLSPREWQKHGEFSFCGFR
jgi:hypothetical protein